LYPAVKKASPLLLRRNSPKNGRQYNLKSLLVCRIIAIKK
jgi:hypothetical protein